MPVTPFRVALITADPGASAFASPREPMAFETVTTLSSEDDHVTAPVTLLVESSVRTAVAVKRSDSPAGDDGFVGVIWISFNVALLTVSDVDPDMPIHAARMVVFPSPIAVARPCDPKPFEICATPVLSEVHVDSPVTFRFEKSE